MFFPQYVDLEYVDLAGRTKTGRLWVYARDDRPWSGADPPAAVYLYSPDRRAERPAAHLAQFKGVVQVDGYPGFERLAAGGDIKLAACWAHARRKLYEVHQATASPIAAEALRRIAELYAIEKTIWGHTADARQRAALVGTATPDIGLDGVEFGNAFAFLAPAIVEEIVTGAPPIELTAQRLITLADLPQTWSERPCHELEHEHADDDAVDEVEEGPEPIHGGLTGLDAGRHRVQHDKAHDDAFGARVVDDLAKPGDHDSPLWRCADLGGPAYGL